YLADQLKRERRQAAELLETRRQQLVMKDQLLSNVSHELRTPLTAVYQFVTILLDGIAGKLNADQQEYLDIALRNVKQLQAMVGDLLDTARADGGKLVIHPRGVTLQRVVNETLSGFMTNVQSRQIALTQDIPTDLPLLHADPQRLKQILTNLVDNAVKFTRESGRITVAARICEEDENFIRVSVSDTGCGLSAESTAKIFDRLYQVEQTLVATRKGLGLGLHIARELVLRHGGRIWVESQLDAGSKFHFTLPVFSLKRSLRYLLESTGAPLKSLFIVGVELQAPTTTPIDVIKALHDMLWVLLNQIELPDQTVLLPNIIAPHGHERFYVAHAKDLGSCSTVAKRIERDIGNCRQVRNANCDVKIGVWSLDLPVRQTDLEVEPLLQQIDECVSRQIPLLGNETPKIEAAGAAVTDQRSEIPACL
ncbi:MAG TPA: ATP-binding protein, partial [Candidatus Binatus sp.]|nr:ATP-binding protein [Candidatus Binatus sp.]